MVIVALVAMLAALVGIGPAHADTAGDEWTFVDLLNQARVQAGLAPLGVVSSVRDVARGWSGQMAGSNTLAHNPNLQAQLQAIAPDWQRIGENVGDGPDAMALSSRLLEHGIFVPAIRPPSVPPGTARLRVTVTAAHTEEHLAAAVEAFSSARRGAGPRQPGRRPGRPSRSSGGVDPRIRGAGGLLVPFSDSTDMADLASALQIPLLVVALPGLGTLNHIALTLEAARTRGLEIAGVVLCGFPAGPGLPGLAQATNPGAIGELAGVVPHLAGLDVDRAIVPPVFEPEPWFVPRLGGRFEVAAFLRLLSRCGELV